MTDQALKGIAAFVPALNAHAARQRQLSPLPLSEKVVSLALPIVEQPVAQADVPVTRDWAAALELVREASEAIRVGEERASQLEQHLADVLTEANAEIKRLTDLISAGENKLAQSEAKASAAETRAVEAEAWLSKLHDAVVASFAPMLGKSEELQPDDIQASSVQN
ncbi:MAG: hypothetical protein EOP23_06755 [Hyphomicrobiales bacterium]|nr:MAG: hypothetical protein EOP23_06755 [Hyphomicrobiales bacterium]